MLRLFLPLLIIPSLFVVMKNFLLPLLMSYQLSTKSSSIHGRFLILIYIILVCFCTLSGSVHAFLKIIPLYQARAL